MDRDEWIALRLFPFKMFIGSSRANGPAARNARSVGNRTGLRLMWTSASDGSGASQMSGIIKYARIRFFVQVKHIIAICLMSLGVPGYGATNTVTFTGNVSIVDDSYNGTPASMASVPLAVPASTTIQNVAVRLAMAHTWIGDLTIKVRNPVGTVVTLMSRPGLAESADDGTGGSGASSDLSASFPILFQKGAAVSAENMGNTLTGSQAICRDDGICNFVPASGAAAAGGLDSFKGQNAFGTWRLYVGDSGAGDTGAINEFTLIITTDDLPRLQITRNGSDVALSWPTASSGFTLESNPELHTTGWTSVNGFASVSGTNYVVTVPATNVSSYFRLKK
jgi:subtilisin-like proprotein convertase family protein